MRRYACFLAMAAASLLPAAVPAETLTYSTGTGFFVDRDGYLLTNNHVVGDCKEITVSGAVPMTAARLVARDDGYDLALLKTDAPVADAASLATAKQPLAPGDPVVIVGYPGQSWEALQTVTRQSRIVNTRGPRGEEKWLEFGDSLAKGNSGGPLLDESANVVGVVTAKAALYTPDADGAPDELVQKFDIAISLPVIRAFLDDHNVPYQQADSGLYLAVGSVTGIARRFVVNVRCRLDR